MTRGRIERRHLLLVGGLAALLAIAVPALGADPSPGPPSPPGQENKPPKADKQEAKAAREQAKAAAKAAKGPEIEGTLTGTIERTTDAKGRPTFTLTVGGVVWELSAGPKWYWGDNNPLAAHVGSSVQVTGTYHEGELELDVATVDGQPIRAAGKPPWAGGPKAVGEKHPGWKAWKAAKQEAKAATKAERGLGREGAPGQQKDKTGTDTETEPGS